MRVASRVEAVVDGRLAWLAQTRTGVAGSGRHAGVEGRELAYREEIEPLTV